MDLHPTDERAVIVIVLLRNSANLEAGSNCCAFFLLKDRDGLVIERVS